MVTWTHHAKTQLKHIHDYIAQDSPFYAKRVSEELVQRTINLDELPNKGHIVPEFNDSTIRELSLYSYRILYEIRDTHMIDILAVIHKRRDLQIDDIARN